MKRADSSARLQAVPAPEHSWRRVFLTSDMAGTANVRPKTLPLSQDVDRCISNSIHAVSPPTKGAIVVQAYEPKPSEKRFLAAFDDLARETPDGIVSLGDVCAARPRWSSDWVRDKAEKLAAKHVLEGLPRRGYKRKAR